MRETDPAEIIIGVDTHKQTHAAIAINGLGARLGAITLSASRRGYHEMETWARSFGPVRAFGIEGTGSYGAGLSRFLQARGHSVIEVNRPNRQIRHQHGKNDPLDAENAARAVLSGQARAAPKAGTSSVEMIRHIKVARDTAVKSRTQAMVTLKTIIVNAPAALRESLEGITGKMTLIRHLAALRPGTMTSPTASAKAALRALARRWLALDAEITSHDDALDALTAACAPALVEAHPRRRQSRAHPLGSSLRQAVRRLSCPCLKRQDLAPPAQPRWQPSGQCGFVSCRHRSNALPSCNHRLRPETNRGGQRQDGDHPLPQTLRGAGDLWLSLSRRQNSCRRLANDLTSIGASMPRWSRSFTP
jgi:transposase